MWHAWELKNTYNILVGKPRGKRSGVGEKIILE
jgi:hypothetical protein